MAFLLASLTSGHRRPGLSRRALLSDGVDYAYQGEYRHGTRRRGPPRVLTWATRPEAALIEVHSHGHLSNKTTFSRTDLDGLDEVVPQMMWRLRGRPYVALVLGADDLDALAWSHRGQPPALPSTVIVGQRTLTPTGIAMDILTRKDDQ